MMQLVPIKNFVEKLIMPGGNHLVKSAISEFIPNKFYPKYKLTSEHTIVSILPLMQRTRSEMQNAVWVMSQHVIMASKVHYKAMLTIMNYCARTMN